MTPYYCMTILHAPLLKVISRKMAANDSVFLAFSAMKFIPLKSHIFKFHDMFNCRFGFLFSQYLLTCLQLVWHFCICFLSDSCTAYVFSLLLLLLKGNVLLKMLQGPYFFCFSLKLKTSHLIAWMVYVCISLLVV